MSWMLRLRFGKAKLLTVSHSRDMPRLGWNPSLSGSQAVALSHPSLCARLSWGSGAVPLPGHSLTICKMRGLVLCLTRAPFWL